jgi:hypothetical protein
MKNLKMIWLVAAVSLMVGCNKGADNSTSVNQRTSSRNAGLNPAQVQTGSNGQYFYTAATGRVYTASQYAQEFSQAMGGLVSASIGKYGNIPLDGVKLRGYIEVDPSGNIITGRSFLSLEIRDDLTGQVEDGQQIPPIYLNIPASGGRAYGGTATITFSDSYGSVTLQGYYTGSQFSGNLSYQNTTNEHSGSGLQFDIQTCGFFRCQ